jgi:hypothetical protein
MPTSTWKGIERAVARELQGVRVPCSGNGNIKGDVIQLRLLPGVIAECKHGRQIVKAGPAKLSEWLREAERDAHTAGALGPVLVLHPEGEPIVDSLVVMRLGLLSGAQRALIEQSKLPIEGDSHPNPSA